MRAEAEAAHQGRADASDQLLQDVVVARRQDGGVEVEVGSAARLDVVWQPSFHAEERRLDTTHILRGGTLGGQFGRRRFDDVTRL